MGFSYLIGLSWKDVTREERYFCQRLFTLLSQGGTSAFLGHLNSKLDNALDVADYWEPAYEVCFYRDLRHAGGREGPLISPKRTFDLCLFSEVSIVIIEAKAQQSFAADRDQLKGMEADRNNVKALTKVPDVYLVSLGSSKCTQAPDVGSVFDARLTWNELALLYNEDDVLLRADGVYENSEGSWGANNIGGYRAGEELLSDYCDGRVYFVGRAGGLRGSPFQEDVRTGKWRAQRYETSFGDTPPNRNWFSLRAFAEAVAPEAGWLDS